MLHNKNVIIP